MPAIADQAGLDGKAQADAARIEVDLHAARLAGLGHELDIGERTAGDQHGVAFLECSLRGLGAEQSDTAGGVGTVIGNRGFAEQGFDDGRAELLCHCLELLARAQSALTRQNRDFASRMKDLRRLAQIFHRGQAGALRAHLGAMVREISFGGLLATAPVPVSR
jgi:hypothetical protein